MGTDPSPERRRRRALRRPVATAPHDATAEPERRPASRNLQLLLVAALAFGVYANTLTNAFVNDDEHQVLMNPWIQDVGEIPTILSSSVWAFVPSRTTTDYYRPVMHLVYLLDFHLFGLEAWGFHLVNALLHAANTVLVFLVGGLLLRKAPDRGPTSPGAPAEWLTGPFVAALLFATHPIHTEAVAWIASVPELTFTLFGLASLALYIREDARPSPRWWPPWICFVLALLCKETAVTLPAVLAAFDLSLGRRPRNAAALGRRWLPYILTLAAYLALRQRVLASVLVHPDSLRNLTPVELALSAVDLFRQYVGALLWPVELNFWRTFEPVEALLSPAALFALGTAAAVGAGCWWAWRHDRRVVFGLALTILPLAPAFYIAALPVKPFAERYLYLPSAGFVLVVALLLDSLHRGRFAARPRWRLALSALVIAVTVLYAGATVLRNRVWTDAFTLYTDSAAKSAGVPRPPISLAAELLARGHRREAIAQFRILAQAEPTNAAFLSALGNALLVDGQNDEALSALRAAAALDPRSIETLNDLAIALRRKGLPADAIALYRQALADDPEFAEAHFNLAGALAEAGEIAGALEHYRAAVRVRPENAYYRSVLGIELARQNDLPGALEQFEAAIRLEPQETAYQKNYARARGLAATATPPADLPTPRR